MTVYQAIRERVLTNSAYLQGRYFAFPRSFSGLYGALVAKGTSLATLPLPFLSFLALPFYGGSTTTINLLFFGLTWSALIWTHDPLTIELYGTLAVRLLCFVIPALGFLAFDCVFPNASQRIKARREQGLPGRLGRDKLLLITGVAVANVLFSVFFQIILEQVFTKVLRLRSLLKVSTAVPLPWNIFTDVLKGLILRGVLHYVVHRYVFHTYDSALKTWHLQWQHSISVPFSIAAAYDHPANFLVGTWLPTFFPAYFMRWHVLTWNLFLALVSLEELFIYSGYTNLPSTIILAGMARRMEAHFDTLNRKKKVGNFGHIGVIDYFAGTTCSGEMTIVQDLQDEAEKRRFQERVEDAVEAALASREKKRQGGGDEDEANDDEESSAPQKKGRRKGIKR